MSTIEDFKNTQPPATAREALDLAWDLAYEVKEGQVIPEGTRYLEFSSLGLKEYVAERSFKISSSELVSMLRTLEPFPDQEPVWLDAPLVIATGCWCPRGFWEPETDGDWKCVRCQVIRHWSGLRYVVPFNQQETVQDGGPWTQPQGAHDAYPEGWTVTHNGKAWVSLSPANVWKPGTSGWREVTEDGAPAEWVQPTGAHDAYKKGDWMTFQGAVYESIIDGNVWSPSAYPAGWNKVN